MAEWMQVASAISAVVVAVVAIIGLWQLILAQRSLDTSRVAIEVARDDIETRIQADAARLSVDLCIRFSESVLPLIDQADLALMSNPLPRATQRPWDLASYESKWNGGPRSRSKLQKVLRALNAMEAVAVPFVWGAANDEIARQSMGAALCGAAFRYAYVIATVRDGHQRDAYPAVRELAERWE